MTTPAFDFSTDVAILGAGPAGAGTSLFLSKAGIPHAIFDAATFPRDKVCGDALSGKVVNILKKLDPALVTDIAARTDIFLGSWGVSFIAPNGKRLDVPFRKEHTANGAAPGFIIKRLDFDNYLVQQLDPKTADIRLGSKVTDVNSTDDGVVIDYQKNGTTGRCLAQLVVGAEGLRSLVARKMANFQGDPKHHAAAIRAYYENVQGMHPENFIELYFFKEVLPGYLWVFPLPNNMANVGVGMLSANMRKAKMNLKELMEYSIHHNPHLSDRFKEARLVGDISGWGLPLGSKKRTLSGERFILTGDAAALIDPFSGEGIGNALVSAHIGSQVIAQAIEQRNFSAAFLADYDQKIYDKLWRELTLSYHMQKWGRSQRLFNAVVNKAIKNPTLTETISCMFEDINMKARLDSPMFYLKLLLNY